MDYIEVSGKNVDEALTNALIELETTSDKVEYEVIEKGSSGFLGMFMIHFFINVGMVMGMMPITGIPLLFLSYGGSSLLTAMTAVGILMSISSRKYDFM